MILFWLICAGFVAMALAFVLPTLLRAVPIANEGNKERANVTVYRDQLSELDADLANGIVSPEQYKQDRDEIERRLLDDVGAITNAKDEKATAASAGRGTVYAFALGMPVLAVSLYLIVGNSAALTGAPTPQSLPASGLRGDGQMTQQGIEANVAAMAKRMDANPGDANGWEMLGRSYMNLEKYGEASNAYGKAAGLKKADADLLAEYAFALAMANGRQLQGQPAELIKQALQIEPENPKVLQLAGSAEFEAKNYRQAIVYWQKLLEKSSGNPELEQSISQRIAEAKSLAGPAAK